MASQATLSYLILGLPQFQGLAAFRTIFLHSSRSCAICSTLSALNPVHAVMLSIQLFRGLPLLLLPGTLPCITVFSRLFCDLATCPACQLPPFDTCQKLFGIASFLQDGLIGFMLLP